MDVYMWNIIYLYTMGCNRGDWEYLQCDLLTCGTLGMNIVEFEHEELADLECSTYEHCIRRMLNICTLYTKIVRQHVYFVHESFRTNM